MFINYRGEDSHSYGAQLYLELARQFSDDQVFLDAESIPAGADFVEELLARVRSSRVLLAVIGSRWLTVTDPTGQRRIDDPADLLHRELAEAFTPSIRVIPVLTEQAELPATEQLRRHRRVGSCPPGGWLGCHIGLGWLRRASWLFPVTDRDMNGACPMTLRQSSRAVSV